MKMSFVLQSIQNQNVATSRVVVPLAFFRVAYDQRLEKNNEIKLFSLLFINV